MISEKNKDATPLAHPSPNATEGNGRWIGIGELAREFGITVRTLRFYHSKGLMSAHWSGGARWFSPADRDRLALIVQCKRFGFSLNEIRDIVGGGDQTDFPLSLRTCAEQLARLERRRHEIDQALAELRRIYAMLEHPGAKPRLRLPSKPAVKVS